MTTSAATYLSEHSVTITAETSDPRLKMIADFATADAVRRGYEVSRTEIKNELKKLRKQARHAVPVSA